FIARHAPENRTLAVHNLVMGERQDEVLEERVMQAEKDLAVMMLAVDRIFADVFERIVHPSHVPLVAKPETALRILMLVECRPVETAEAVGIVGEVSRHPVNDDAQALLVASIDHGGKVGRSAEATGGRKKSGRLIAPGSVERMFADRQEFDMREPHVARVSWQFLRQLAVAQPAAAMVRMPPPRSKMDFIDRYRRTQG